MRKEYSVEFLNEIKVRFPDVSIKIHSARSVYVKIPRDKVHDLAKFLFEEKSLRLSTATGIDTRDGIEIIYNFSHDAS